MRAFERDDPGTLASATLSITEHALLLIVLFFGIRWKTKQPDPVMAELWTQLPVVEPPRVEPPKPPPVVEPKPEPKPEPPPEPKVEAKPPPKPDIALEDERKKQEELKAKEERERRERELAEKRRSEEETRKRMQDQLNRELASAAPKTGPVAPTLGDPRARSEWGDRIRAKIRSNIVLPPDLAGNPEAVFDVQLLPTGEVLTAKLRKSSGVRAYDDAVERAILKSSPLPLPEKREVFEARLELRFRPQD